MQNKIKDYLASKRDDIVSDIKALASIPSIQAEALPGMPFGEACFKALKASEQLFASAGLDCRIAPSGKYLLANMAGNEKTVGIFSHADVVPVDESDWTLTSPFVPIEKDGFLVGRGVEDNKSGIVSALWALKCAKELGIDIKSSVTVFVGGSEETGMADIEEFAKTEKMPDFSIVPDNDYPVCRGEKGIMNFYIVFKTPFEDILSFEGGSAFNIVLGALRARIAKKRGLEDELRALTADKSEFTLTDCADFIEISAKGIPSHAAHPENSLNAAYLLASLLVKVNALSSSDKKILNSAIALLSDPFLRNAGLYTEDTQFGSTTCSNGIAALRDRRLALSFDCRYGSEIDHTELVASIEKAVDAMGAELVDLHNLEGYSIPDDAPVITAVMEAYKEITGNTDAKPYLSFGGTYARHLKNAVSVGTYIPVTPPLKLPQGHGGVHQSDETLDIAGLLDSINILLHMIIKADSAINE